MRCTLKNGQVLAEVETRGAELVSLRVGERELLWSGDPAVWEKHAPLLFPICGRLKDGQYTYAGREYRLGCHGFLSGLAFSVKEAGDGLLVLGVTDDESTREVYPFSFEVTVRFVLSSCGISVAAGVKNTGDAPMPMMFGFHPAIALPTDAGMRFDDYRLLTPGCTACECFPLVNGSFVSKVPEILPLPDGAYPLSEKEIHRRDTVVLRSLPGTVILTADREKRRGGCDEENVAGENGGYSGCGEKDSAGESDKRDGCGEKDRTGGGGGKLALSRSESLPYLCLWKKNAPGADFLCLEPWSGVPSDGVAPEDFGTRGGMISLLPGASEEFRAELCYTEG